MTCVICPKINIIQIISQFPSRVEEAHQYKWLMMLRVHSPTKEQSFSFASACNFFFSPINSEYYKKGGACVAIMHKSYAILPLLIYVDQ